MDYSSISEQEWNELAREFAKKYARSVLPDKGDNIRAAEVLNMSISSVEQMKISGKGSIKTWFKLMAFDANISPVELKNLVNSASTIFKNSKPMSDIENQFEKLKENFSSNELSAYFRLLLSKKEIEKSFQVKINISDTSQKKTD